MLVYLESILYTHHLNFSIVFLVILIPYKYLGDRHG